MSDTKVPDTTAETATVVDRAITALSAFGVTTEREAGRLLPMWLHYGEMTADDKIAVYRHYRTELAGGAR